MTARKRLLQEVFIFRATRYGIGQKRGDELEAIGMYSSATNFDGQWISKYQYGVFVRPELNLP